MMMADITKMKEFLAALPIDTAEEIRLLNAVCTENSSETKAVLFVGDAAAAPFLLLPTDTQIFDEDDTIPFPIDVVWGSQFSISVIDGQETVERYHTAEDFRHFCKNRFAGFHRCTVELPDDRLRGIRLVYFLLTADMAALTDASHGCDSCVMVLAADAPGLTDETQALCQWLTGERCIGQNTAVLLRDRGYETNEQLLIMTEYMLDGEPQSFQCDVADDSGTVSDIVFSAAASVIGESSNDDEPISASAQSMFAGISRKTRTRLEAESEAQKVLAAQAEILLEKYKKAAREFRAMCDTAKYSLSSLDDEEIKSIYDEIDAFFAMLNECIPGMIQDVLKNSDSAKSDLKNLTGDYINDQVDAFVSALTDDIAAHCLIPRAEEHLTRLIDQFRLMYEELHLASAETKNLAKTEFLQIADMNIGNYKPYLIGMLEEYLHSRVGLLRLLQLFGMDAAGGIADALDRYIDALGDLLTLKKPFANKIKNMVIQQMQDTKEQVKLQIKDTVIPRMGKILLTAFDEQTEGYITHLTVLADDAEAHRTAAQNTVAVIAAALAEIDTIFPTAEG